MNKKGIIYTVTAILVGVLTGCVSDEPDMASGQTTGEGFLEASIDPLGINPTASGTRAMQAVGSDQWSYVRFDSPTDTIGFYSMMGNVASGTDAPFINEPMVWTRSVLQGNNADIDNRWRGVFSGINMDYDVSLIQTANNKVFVYFPYAIGVGSKGLVLRREAPDGSLRCVDALYIQNFVNNNEAILSGSFNHGFSELMITRGNGFDNPPEGCERITVVLNKGFSHAKVAPYEFSGHDDYWVVLTPVYNEDYYLDEQQCRRWDAWRGDDYRPDELTGAIPAYYCIVPTGLSSLNSVVDYIEIYDNLGELHKVTSFYLRSENNKSCYPGYRYQLKIVMEGLVPTVYPFGIEPWDTPTNITDQRSSGINNPAELLEFVTEYNTYIMPDGTRRPNYDESKLEKFGDKYVKDGVLTGWHFYLNNSFEVPNDYNLRILNLCDTIDGRRNALSDLKITDYSGFIGEIREGGCLMNFNLKGFTVTNNFGVSGITGGIANSITGGSITGCSIDGFINTPGRVGMIAGTMTGGSVTGCTFTGLLVGGATANKLIAIEPEGGSIENNNTTGLLFTDY